MYLVVLFLKFRTKKTCLLFEQIVFFLSFLRIFDEKKKKKKLFFDFVFFALEVFDYVPTSTNDDPIGQVKRHAFIDTEPFFRNRSINQCCLSKSFLVFFCVDFLFFFFSFFSRELFVMSALVSMNIIATKLLLSEMDFVFYRLFFYFIF